MNVNFTHSNEVERMAFREQLKDTLTSDVGAFVKLAQECDFQENILTDLVAALTHQDKYATPDEHVLLQHQAAIEVLEKYIKRMVPIEERIHFFDKVQA